ncbi:hypothetical protein JAAARDRAFT_118239 [Jaapia argillacea MUCL 33604]|uniref:AAA+ ATPase domain-containing protein n=1 Tax=Jaapia argillacea MUCL 33604 TaxID=933084 RepID=A0A067QBR9_9AGAM|nr:hypothetical protein JAAARDRAFT_118239 [Jaapia argillacea MUCL 33604]
MDDLDDSKGKNRGKKRSKKTEDNRPLKRRRVIRSVPKKGNKQQTAGSDDEDEDDWIVDDNEIDGEDDVPIFEDTSLPFFQSLHPTLPNPSPEAVGDLDDDGPKLQVPNNFLKLYNTILLTGPPGSGKTAAVYACAQELEWEVFEVYPGIGKRSGANLERLIGEVGKNHVLGRSRSANSSALEILGVHDEQTDDFHEHPVPPTTDPAIRQSLILLEEVDVIFKDDTNFWDAVVQLIAKSRRPVILTCNGKIMLVDVSFIKLNKLPLPLQAILTFTPSPPSLAASYLQAISLREGFLVNRKTALSLFDSSREPAPPDYCDATCSRLARVSQTPDLRRAIHHLQFWHSADSCDYTPSSQGRCASEANTPAEMEQGHDALALGVAGRDITQNPQKHLRSLHRLYQHIEAASFVDSNLCRRSLQTPEVRLLLK